MGTPASEARRMPLAEYDILSRGWNDAHKKEDDVRPPTPEEWEAQQARIARNPALTQSAPC